MTTAGEFSSSLRRLPPAAQQWLHQLPAEQELDPLLALRSAVPPVLPRCAAHWKLRLEAAGGDCEPRMVRTLAYHWWRFSEQGFRPLTEVVEALQRGELAYGQRSHALLAEVFLCECCARGDDQATRLFLEQYTGVIREAARRSGGAAAARQLHDFPAELVVPREGRPPRLGLFAGYTPLDSWLQQVVRNEWITRCRRRQVGPTTVPLEETGPLVAPAAGPAEWSAGGECAEKLRPLFQRVAAVLTEAERLLLRLVVLEEVPQNAVAKLMNVHKSTITRARQRACEKLREAFTREAVAARRRGEAADCLEWLRGASPMWRQLLAEELAASLRESGEETAS